MRHVAFRAAEILVLPTIVLVVVLVLAPGRAELAIHVYTLVLLAAGLASLVGAIAGTEPDAGSSFDAALEPRDEEDEGLPELARLEREVALAQASAFDYHYRLRPVLRDVAAGLLASRRGIDLDRRPERAHEVLGDEAFALVRRDVEPAWDRRAAGPDLALLRRTIARLETL